MYGRVQCQAINVSPYSGFQCWRVPHYSVIYGPSEIRVLRVHLVNNRYVSLPWRNLRVAIRFDGDTRGPHVARGESGRQPLRQPCTTTSARSV